MPPPEAETLEVLQAAIDRAYRRLETAEIELAAALERHRYASERARSVLGGTLGVGMAPAAPPAGGEALHRALGVAGAGVIAARRQASTARHELRAARSALRRGAG